MKAESRINAILQSNHLDFSIIGIPTFELNQLELPKLELFELPTNVRLGHLVEKIVAELIKQSHNYRLEYENVQLIDQKRTIGEIDFIIKDLKTNTHIHLELAYKFYLYDPTISSNPIHNWIGPNRRDSLSQKRHKLREKQLPLLNHSITKSILKDVDVDNTNQAVCFLASLFIPYKFKGNLPAGYQSAVKGYYLDYATFEQLDEIGKVYHIPTKKSWGIDPCENTEWADFNSVKDLVLMSIQEKQAPLCWQKYNDEYVSFFIVWW